jgi:hypothetical protein
VLIITAVSGAGKLLHMSALLVGLEELRACLVSAAIRASKAAFQALGDALLFGLIRNAQRHFSQNRRSTTLNDLW